MVIWICCTGKKKIKISNFSPGRKQLIQKSRFQITSRKKPMRKRQTKEEHKEKRVIHTVRYQVKVNLS